MQPNLETSLSLTSSEHFVLQYCLVPDCPHQAKLSKSKQLLGTITPILGTINKSTSSRTMWKKGGNTEYNIFSCFPIITQSCCTEMKYASIACSWAGGWTRWNILHEGIHTHVQSSIQHPERCLSCLQHHIPSHEHQRSTLNFYKL